MDLVTFIKQNSHLQQFNKNNRQMAEMASTQTKYQKIYVFAQGGSMINAKIIGQFRQNDQIVFVSSLDEKTISKIHKKDLLVFITFSGRSPEIIEQIQELKDHQNSILFTSNDELLKEFTGKSVKTEICPNFTSRFAFLAKPYLFLGNLLNFNLLHFYLGSYFASLKMLDEPNVFSMEINELEGFFTKNTLHIFTSFSHELRNLNLWKRHLAIELFCHDGAEFYFDIFEAPFDFHSKIQLFMNLPQNKFFHVYENEPKFEQILKQQDIGFINNSFVPLNEFTLGKEMFQIAAKFIMVAQKMGIQKVNEQKFIDQYKSN